MGPGKSETCLAKNPSMLGSESRHETGRHGGQNNKKKNLLELLLDRSRREEDWEGKADKYVSETKTFQLDEVKGAEGRSPSL